MDEVSPALIREVEFSTELRGFNKDEVDDFLDRVAAGVELLQQQLRQALERAARAEQLAAEAADTDQALRRTLVMAQRAADMAVAEAKEEAARIRADAEAEADAIVARAREEAERLAAEAQAALRADIARLEAARARLEADIAALSSYVASERERLRRALTDEIERIEAISTLAPAPVTHAVDLPPAPRPPAEEPASGDEAGQTGAPVEAAPVEGAGAEASGAAEEARPPATERGDGAGEHTVSVEVATDADSVATDVENEEAVRIDLFDRDDDELFGRAEDFPDELDFDRSWWRRRRR